MRTTLQTCFLATLTILVSATRLSAQGTAFTYQGRLLYDGSPASGHYDLTFSVWTNSTGAAQVDDTVTNLAVAVSNGLFTVTLDFGASVFTGGDRWLEIAVRTNGGGAFTTLSPRQSVTPSPYAIYAGNVRASGISGVVPATALAGTYANAVQFTNAGSSFTGNGTGLTNVNAATLGGLNSSNFWQLGGNAGATPGTHFLGTTDNQPLEFKVNGLRVLRIVNSDSGDPGTAPDGAPNWIGGSPHNFMAAGVVGATIAGGGATGYFGLAYTNSIAGNFGVIGGGARNEILSGAHYGFIAGGYQNRIVTNSVYSSIGGGTINTIGTEIGADYGSIGGGHQNNIEDFSSSAVIAGGAANSVGNNSDYGVIGGGQVNEIASGYVYATIPGGYGNYASAHYSYAAGRRAQANHDGAFVWADSQDAGFPSTTTNQFNVRASGGARFVTAGAGMTVDGATVFTGTNGSSLTSLNASQISSGTLSDARLSGNVALENVANTFTASQTINGTVTATGFSGSGSGLTTLNASQISSGTLSDARLSGNVAFENVANTFTTGQTINGTVTAASFIGSGSGLTNLNASQISSGTLSDARLSGNVALESVANTFTVAQTISSAGNTPQLELAQTTAGSFARLRYSVAGTDLWDVAASGTDRVLNFYNPGNGNVMVLSTNGHLKVTQALGVGADSTDAHMTVAGDDSQPQLYLQQTTAYAEARLRMAGSTGRYWDMLADNSGDYIRWYAEATGFDAMTLMDDGTLITTGPVNPPSDRNVKQDFRQADASEVLEKVAALPIQTWAYKNSPEMRHIGPMAPDFHAPSSSTGMTTNTSAPWMPTAWRWRRFRG